MKNNKFNLSNFSGIFCLLLFYIPFTLLFLLGFSGTIDISNFYFSTKGFNSLFSNSPFLHSIIITIVVGLISSLASVFLGFTISICLSLTAKKIQNVSKTIIAAPLLNPDICNSLAVTFLFIMLFLKFGIFTLICSHIILSLPYAIFLLFPQANRVKNEYLRSAQDLGASYLYTVRKIYYPLMFKMIVVTFFICLAISIDDFIFSFFNGGNIENLSVIIYSTKIIRPFLYSFGLLSFLFFSMIYIIFVFRIKIKSLLIKFICAFNISSQKNDDDLLEDELPINRNLAFQQNVFYIKRNEHIRKKISKKTQVLTIVRYLNYRKMFIIFFVLFITGLILSYFIILERNNINLYIFNGYISGNSISAFSKENNTNLLVNEYDTNEIFFSKTQFTNFDIAMVSDYAVNDEISKIHKLTKSDEDLFCKYYNYYIHTNKYHDIKNIFSNSNTNSPIYNVYSNYMLSNNENLLDYSIPFSVNDIRFLFRNTDKNINTKLPYKKIYDDAMSGKKVVVYNDPRDIMYLGIMIGEDIEPENIELIDGKVSFSQHNLEIANKYLKNMFKNSNTIVQTDIEPSFFLNNTLDDAYMNGYNYLSWFENSSLGNEKMYSLIDPNGYVDKNDKNDIRYTTNIWEDGFIINKNVTGEKLKKCIKFLAYEYSNKIALSNVNENSLYIPTNYCTNYILNNKQYYFCEDFKNKNFLVPQLNTNNNYSSYYLFTNQNEDLIRLIYSQIFSHQ